MPNPITFQINEPQPITYDFGSIFIHSGEPVLEIGSATPSTETQVFLPSTGYDGFEKFTVNPIPSNYGLITYSGFELTVS